MSPQPQTAVGAPLSRVDGRLKVTGRADYAADHTPEGVVYAVVVGSSVGLGRITGVDTAVALAAIADLSERVGNYIDLVIEGLIDIYETERRRWNSRTGAARAAQIRLVLESEGLGEDAAESLLGWSLGGWHQAAVVWLPPDIRPRCRPARACWPRFPAAEHR
ncbi:hypothetical protein AMES_5680 [Amycolatopsis mediterranei S699]|uniref:RsbT co-antagonist protein RsbRD N-terminal domain-containing protein n=2 Tax=Amycolatopsis mediterranei TaxID=33910 RepID=A0A0H3D923_AMYMU|nr:hypothetical protein [Amycolatopsis mediterranei]ADJ47505.1 conserved hypothetical protein [Amycolatopsis mediterranei U32]AEK44361.1 hypothetical protein RAM_29430 [Amycolatopsis mediterranei S699]AFO79216.1 hypothetical protein AMES_5680 [Amycolatopsis mediterranei S699]AGT86344.1 hypothetical protein B737_5680 [Amycolatopsis mediterranei RB]KDO12567.1 hypothetical protein DV26_01195 [Amycolatopsis mediterranei]